MANVKSIHPDRIDDVIRKVGALQRDHAGEADTIFISAPKSGRTWVRVFLARYVEKLYDTDFTIDEMPGSPWWRNLQAKNVPCVYFSHNFFDPFQDVLIEPFILDPEWLSRRNCCLILRDPRDTVVSYFHQKAARENLFDDDIAAFVESEVYGVERLSRFNVLAFEWFESRGAVDRVFTYEGLVAVPNVTFKRLLAASGLPYDTAAFDYALDRSSFDAMRAQEVEHSTAVLSENNRIYPLRTAQWSGDVNELKMRRGKVGSYLDELPAALRERIAGLPQTRHCVEIVGALTDELS